MVVVNGLCEDVIWLLLTVLCLEEEDKELPEIFFQQTQQNLGGKTLEVKMNGNMLN